MRFCIIHQKYENLEKSCGVGKEVLMGKKQKVGIKALLIILFILSLGSLYFALWIVSISVEASPIPDFPGAIIDHAWKFFLILPLPLTSTMLGVVYIKKGYKCKKNIIAGIIMTVLLCIYGSFTFIFSDMVGHDFAYAQELSATVNIEIPADSYVAYMKSLDESGDTTTMMITIPDSAKSDFLQTIDGNNGWKKSTAHIPANAIDISTLGATLDYDYFAVYNESKHIYSDYEGKLIFMAYDVETSVLYVAM